MTIFTQAKKLKGMKQQLKVFRLLRWQVNIFYWARLQNKCSATVNTSQMMLIPFYWAVKCFPCWESSTSHQSFLLKSSKISVNRSQTHNAITVDQIAMKLLATNLTNTISQFFQDFLLTCCQTSALLNHALAIKSQTFPQD